jgi:hypothetical protein
MAVRAERIARDGVPHLRKVVIDPERVCTGGLGDARLLGQPWRRPGLARCGEDHAKANVVAWHRQMFAYRTNICNAHRVRTA